MTYIYIYMSLRFKRLKECLITRRFLGISKGTGECKFHSRTGHKSQRGRIGINLFFLYPRLQVGWVLKATTRLFQLRETDPIPIVMENVREPEPIQMGAEKFPHWDSKSEKILWHKIISKEINCSKLHIKALSLFPSRMLAVTLR